MYPTVPASGLHFKTALLPQGWARNVRIEHAGGRITRIEQGVKPTSGDERGLVGLPGIPNLHSHAFQRGMAGLTERHGVNHDGFWSWRKLMYRFAARLAPEDLQALAAQAYVEMLEAGFTRVCEFHYLHHAPGGARYANPAEMVERIAAAAADTGIGLSLLPVFYAHSSFGGAAPAAEQARFVNDVDGYGQLLEASRTALTGLHAARLGIAPHSLRAATPEELRDILPLAADGPVHIHIAEQPREVIECEAMLGARPVQWLLNEMPVDARWCLIHATHVTGDELAGLAASGAVAGLCPITEANLGDGLFPVATYQAQGGRFGVGTDSNLLIDLAEELRLLDYGQRLRNGIRNALATPERSTGRALFEATLQGGLRASGVGMGASADSDEPASAVGLHAGAHADILSLADHVALTGRGDDAILDSFIYAARPGLIDCVWRAGHKLVCNGVHAQRASIATRFRATLQRLLNE